MLAPSPIRLKLFGRNLHRGHWNTHVISILQVTRSAASASTSSCARRTRIKRCELLFGCTGLGTRFNNEYASRRSVVVFSCCGGCTCDGSGLRFAPLMGWRSRSEADVLGSDQIKQGNTHTHTHMYIIRRDTRCPRFPAICTTCIEQRKLRMCNVRPAVHDFT